MIKGMRQLFCAGLLFFLTVATYFAEENQAKQGQTTERITIDSGEWRIVGDLVLPKAGTPVAAVILLNQAAGDRTAYEGLAGQLAKYGVGSLRIDLRGHGDTTNRGRFVPGEGTAILKETERDVAAAHEWLRRDKRVDPRRIGFVGASYSGEAMMQAARTAGYGAAYVGLSPGSLSDESIAAIDREHLTWLLVVSRHERYLTEVAQALRVNSHTAEFLELSGTEHATNLLAAHPDLAERIAVWFRYKLARER
jgi:dienelactone hydrolase